MWIELSEFHIKIFLPLVYPIFKRIEDIPKKAYLTKDNQLFKTFRYFFSYCLSFIPFLIIKLRTKKANNKEEKLVIKKNYEQDENSTINEINELSKKIKKKRLIQNIIFLIILSLSGWFCYFYRYLFEKKEFEFAKQSVGIFFINFVYIALCIFILKKKIYKHNYVSSLIIALVLLILFIITIFYMESEYIFLSFIYYFFFAFCFGLYDVLGKKYMINFFETPYFLMLVVGIIDVIALLIFDLFIYFLDSDIKGIIIGFQNNVNNVSKTFIFISDIILQWIWNVGIWLTIYYLSPCHYFMSEYISEYAYYLVNANSSNNDFYKTTNIVIFSIAFFINFFCCLIFNEVIILNFLGLDYNTEKRIKERVSNDSTSNIICYTEMDNRYNNEEEEDNIS